MNLDVRQRIADNGNTSAWPPPELVRQEAQLGAECEQ